MNIWQCTTKLIVYPALLAGAVSVSAALPDMRLTGLAMHQETGRNIYLGGIYFDPQVPTPDNLIEAGGPKLMEYRVVARRTSIRSLLGGILLQSELASGKAPDSSVAQFVNDLLEGIQGSLYAGDCFQIMLSENDETIAYLNGQEMARIDDGRVSDYMLAGWIGEQGPSTAFRTSIVADSVDPDLLATLEKTVYSEEREQQVAEWVGSDTADEVAVTTPEQAPVKAPEKLAAVPVPTVHSVLAATAEQPAPPPKSADDALLATTATAVPVTSEPVDEPGVEQAARSRESEPPIQAVQAGEVQVASLLPEAALPEARENEALVIQNYSQRLAAFNTQVLKKVYAQIRYPTRAVRRGLEGRVELDVTLQESGELLDITIAQSSGYKILDKAAVTAAGKALSSIAPSELDPVAIAEFGGDDDVLVVPVPVQFMLTE